MTFETGTAVDFEDLLAKLDTFADTTHGGWVGGYTPNPDTTNRWFELSKGSLSMSMRYPSGITALDNVSLHQATAFLSTGTAPGAHTNDSGSGYNTGVGGTSANFDDERCVSQIGNGPYPSYSFFADDTSPADYIHCVIEVSTGMFRHFGFGTLGRGKFGDWSGGEYVYGQHQQSGTTLNQLDNRNVMLPDGIATAANDARRCGTIHLQGAGLSNQGGLRWGVMCAALQTTLDNDTAGAERRVVLGTARAGLEVHGLGNMIGNSSSGVVALCPVALYYHDPTLSRVQYLGHLDDVRTCNTRNFSPGEEIVIGVDTWVIFPASIKTVAGVNYRSEYFGVAYRKVV
tara:strand:- start:15571 stop:16602 length:1032 start_codon:yes stop_codon:yes gene_type:complete